MAEYVPNTMVVVLKDVPLDDTYTDTRWFNTESQQQTFFMTKGKYTFRDMTYQRVNNGIAQPRIALTCRVPMIADNLYDCNYMMFQNSNYGNKWFYAFIKQVNYINPNNTELVYEIDYLQTFMFDFQIKASFVEREHASAAEDVPFYNLTPEPLEVPNWCEDVSQFTRLGARYEDGYVIRVSYYPSSLLETIGIGLAGKMYNGIYSGTVCKFYTSAAMASADIAAAYAVAHTKDRQEAIIADVSMCPNNAAGEQEGQRAKETTVTTNINYLSTSFTTSPTSYTVRNKKLLNSQFTFIKATSDSGEEQVWKPELFYGQDGTVSGLANEISMPEYGYCFTPKYYMRNAEFVEYGNADYSINFRQEVHCTWNDFGWAANIVKAALLTAATMGMGAIASAAGATLTGSAAMPSLLGSASTAAKTVTGSQLGGKIAQSVFNMNKEVETGVTLGQLGDIASLFTTSEVNNTRRSVTGDALAYAMGLRGIEIKRMCPDSQTLEKFDTFFDMFGYQVNKVKVPNLNTRQSWNYVKLNNPCIYGSVPVEGMRIIKRAFANGIRLWHVDAVGDYSVENPAV